MRVKLTDRAAKAYELSKAIQKRANLLTFKVEIGNAIFGRKEEELSHAKDLGYDHSLEEIFNHLETHYNNLINIKRIEMEAFKQELNSLFEGDDISE